MLPAAEAALRETVLAKDPSAVPIENQLNKLSDLLEHLEPEAENKSAPAPTAESEAENQLAQVRLGLANSLFAALRCKHAFTASHSVRVALGCSAWALAKSLPDEERDALEIAALLHDVGKIGVPDTVLLKPAELTTEEHALMDRHRQMGLGILENCCASAQVLEIVRHTPTWFDGSRMRVDRDGPDLPLGARMLAIVDAFDSMITPQVYRPALSRERAIKELCDFAGTQFDPQLVLHFAALHATDQQKLHRRVARRWLQELDKDSANNWWQLQQPGTPAAPANPETYFPQSLLTNMYDGVIFLDTNCHVSLWNRGAEQLTGISGNSMLQRPFVPSLLELRDETGRTFSDAECPVALRDAQRRAIAAADDFAGSRRPRTFGQHAHHSGGGSRRRRARSDAGVARCFGPGLAGRALPKPVRAGHARSAYAIGQPGRIRSRAHAVCRTCTWNAA